MKKLILIFAMLFSIANYMAAQISRMDGAESSNKPVQMVVEGRTWWYNAPVAGLNDQDFGFRIAAPVDIDGETWYPVQQIRYLVTSPNEEPVLSDEVITICHIRQEGSKVFTRYSAGEELKEHPLFIQLFGPLYHLTREQGENRIIDFELFGEEGREFVYTSTCDGSCGYDPDDNEFVKFAFDKHEAITNSGFDYQRYILNVKGYNEDCRHLQNATVYSVPEFGYTDSGEYLSELFFAPLGVNPYDNYPHQMQPRLCYVTDEDNNILFEGKGGFKLWEYDPAGTEDVQIAPASEDEIWFTLDGRKVEPPTAVGIYIRRAGSKIEKVIKK
ncbi:MAG: hypothetical protein K2M19_04915 [Muribaculaceae bacterium]|nr:hypothetical protein [Muribaculaceae bacterium]